MRPESILQLFTNTEHWVQGVEGILKNHGGFTPAKGFHLGRSQIQDIAPLIHNMAS